MKVRGEVLFELVGSMELELPEDADDEAIREALREAALKGELECDLRHAMDAECATEVAWEIYDEHDVSVVAQDWTPVNWTMDVIDGIVAGKIPLERDVEPTRQGDLLQGARELVGVLQGDTWSRREVRDLLASLTAIAEDDDLDIDVVDR